MPTDRKPHLRVERSPIKLILPKQGKERKNPIGGDKPVPFRVVDQAFRESLVTQVSAARQVPASTTSTATLSSTT